MTQINSWIGVATRNKQCIGSSTKKSIGTHGIKPIIETEWGVGTWGIELGVDIGGTKLGSNTRGIRLVIGTRRIKWAENSPPPKLEFSTTIKEHQPR